MKDLTLHDMMFVFHCKFQEQCHQYWPDTGTVQIGEYTVDLLGEEKREEFLVRTIGIQHKKVKRWFVFGKHLWSYY